jgi:formiminotetrahydrofolate cyclodeaminase
MMVASLPRTRSGSDADRTALAGAARALAPLQARLTDAIDLDAAAYDRVVAAYRLAKATAAEQSARAAAIQDALRAATEVPLDVMRASVLALDEARTVAAHGHAPAASDIGVAVALLHAGLRGARLNVAANQAGLKDAGYAAAVGQEAERLADGAECAAQAARTLLDS